MINNLEKQIYNTYLAISRGERNKPFRLRKDFEKFEEDEQYLHVKKLGIFFQKFPHVEMKSFFKAPYKIYARDESFNLKFYTSQKALKIYTLYQTKKSNADPDTENQLYFIRNSLNFIVKFCQKNGISFDEYIKHKTNDMYTFLLHLKERRISIYVLFGFDGFEKYINDIPNDILNFMFDDLRSNIDKSRSKYFTSSKAKILIQEGIKRITKNS